MLLSRRLTSLLIALAASALLFPSFANARGHNGGRHSTGPSYGGGHHTVSHGGHYVGGQGSSHKGGHYLNPSTGNHYGHHKAPPNE